MDEKDTNAKMISYFEIKPIEETFLHWIKFLTITLFNNKHYRRIRLFILIFHISLVCVNIYFYITVFDTDFFFQYITSLLGLTGSVCFNVSFFLSEKEIGKLEGTIYSCFWSPSSTTKQAEKSIIRNSKYVTYMVILNTSLGILAAIVLMPIGKAVDHQFAMFFFRTYLPNLHYLLDVIFFLSFIVTGPIIVNWANMIAYYCCHSKCQLTLCAEVAKYLCVNYEDQDDNSLFYSTEYQQIIKERIRFIIVRHTELLRVYRIVSGVATELLPLLTLGGIAMCFSGMSFVYLIEIDFLYWRYFQLFVWGITSLVTGILIIQSGQELEDQTGGMYATINDVRWITFNESNKRSVIIILTMAQVPVRIKFTDTVSVNYKLGIQIARSVYSFTAIFARAYNFRI